MAAPYEAADTEPLEELNSSELGTKEYWDKVYSRELENFKESGDIGEVWFGNDSVDRVVDWLQESPLVAKDASVLDLGCGNGYSLIELNKAGFTTLTGVDYSDDAVRLARAVAEEEQAAITYQQGDILQTPPSCICLQKTYNILLDKGTYDAISLCPDNPAEKRATYISNVQGMLGKDGLLVLTSCNWTEAELLQQFSKAFDFHEKIPAPTFQFGGCTGSRETTLVFKKKS